MRIRLYIDTREQESGLYYGKNRIQVCDDCWQVNISSDNKNRPPSPLWRHIYYHDKAKSVDDWYALDINKFAVLT